MIFEKRIGGTTVMRWVHFADMHFNFDAYDTDRMRDGLLEYIPKIKEKKIDFMCITGDFRFAPKKEFKEETKTFISNIQKKLEIEEKPLYCVVGNHDVNRNPTRKDLVVGLRQKYNSGEGEIDQSTLNHLNLDFSQFDEFLQDSAGEIIGKKNPHRFIAHPQVNIICMNTSITSCEKSADEYGQLIVGIKYLKECMENIDHSKPTIALGHHSLESLRYSEKIRVEELFKKYNVHIYLCGHNHVFQVSNASSDEKYKLYEIFSGNLYTEERYSQCGFLVADLQDNVLKLECYEWDFNSRKWHLSNTYSDDEDEREKTLYLYSKKENKNLIGCQQLHQLQCPQLQCPQLQQEDSMIQKVMMIDDHHVSISVPTYEKEFFRKNWPVVHYNEYEYTLRLVNAISTRQLQINVEYNATYPSSEIHIGGPTVNAATYKYLMNYVPSYRAIVRKENVTFEESDDRNNMIMIEENTGFRIVDENGEEKKFYREYKKSDIGVLVRLKVNRKKTVHLMFGTGKRGTMVAINYLINSVDEIYERCGDQNYFLVVFGNYMDYSIDFSRNVCDLSYLVRK